MSEIRRLWLKEPTGSRLLFGVKARDEIARKIQFIIDEIVAFPSHPVHQKENKVKVGD